MALTAAASAREILVRLHDVMAARTNAQAKLNQVAEIVAEGLETLKAWVILNRLGCDEGQGYYICKPMPQDQFIAWAKSWQPPDASAATAESMMARLG